MRVEEGASAAECAAGKVFHGKTHIGGPRHHLPPDTEALRVADTQGCVRLQLAEP